MPDKGKEQAKSSDDENVDRQKLGARLREAREYLGLSQDEVAKYLNIPRTALSHIESGQRRIDALELKKVGTTLQAPGGLFHRREPIRGGHVRGCRSPRARSSGPVGRRPQRIESVRGIPPGAQGKRGFVEWLMSRAAILKGKREAARLHRHSVCENEFNKTVAGSTYLTRS